jgi:hypothetical protein
MLPSAKDLLLLPKPRWSCSDVMLPSEVDKGSACNRNLRISGNGLTARRISGMQLDSKPSKHAFN